MSSEPQDPYAALLSPHPPPAIGGAEDRDPFDQLDSDFKEKFGRPLRVTARDNPEHLKLHGPGARDVGARDMSGDEVRFVLQRSKELGMKTRDFSKVIPHTTSTGIRITGKHIHFDPQGIAQSEDDPYASILQSGSVSGTPEQDAGSDPYAAILSAQRDDTRDTMGNAAKIASQETSTRPTLMTREQAPLGANVSLRTDIPAIIFGEKQEETSPQVPGQEPAGVPLEMTEGRRPDQTGKMKSGPDVPTAQDLAHRRLQLSIMAMHQAEMGPLKLPGHEEAIANYNADVQRFNESQRTKAPTDAGIPPVGGIPFSRHSTATHAVETPLPSSSATPAGVEINLTDFIHGGTLPSEEEIGKRSYQGLGYTDEEATQFAKRLLGKSPVTPAEVAGVFYKAGSPDSASVLTRRASLDPGGRVVLPDLDTHASDSKRAWLQAYRGERLKEDTHTQRQDTIHALQSMETQKRNEYLPMFALQQEEAGTPLTDDERRNLGVNITPGLTKPSDLLEHLTDPIGTMQKYLTDVGSVIRGAGKDFVAPLIKGVGRAAGSKPLQDFGQYIETTAKQREALLGRGGTLGEIEQKAGGILPALGTGSIGMLSTITGLQSYGKGESAGRSALDGALVYVGLKAAGAIANAMPKTNLGVFQTFTDEEIKTVDEAVTSGQTTVNDAAAAMQTEQAKRLSDAAKLFSPDKAKIGLRTDQIEFLQAEIASGRMSAGDAERIVDHVVESQIGAAQAVKGIPEVARGKIEKAFDALIRTGIYTVVPTAVNAVGGRPVTPEGLATQALIAIAGEGVGLIGEGEGKGSALERGQIEEVGRTPEIAPETRRGKLITEGPEPPIPVDMTPGKPTPPPPSKPGRGGTAETVQQRAERPVEIKAKEETSARQETPIQPEGGPSNLPHRPIGGGQRPLEGGGGAPGLRPSGKPTEGPRPVATAEKPPTITTVVDEGAHGAATSPTTELPGPTEAQISAGNYQKGHIKVSGLDVSIENPQGSVRTGTTAGGEPWSRELHSHYGYLKSTQGADGEHVDTFIKPGTKPDYSGPVFVVNQTDDKGKFDEHKTMLGFDSKQKAIAGYVENYDPGAAHFNSVAEFANPQEFKTWLNTADLSKPAEVTERGGQIVAEEPAHVPGVAGVVKRAKEAERRAERKAAIDEQTGLASKNEWVRARTSIDRDADTEVAVLDINHLKKFNDQISHDAGDQYIEHAAKVIKEEAQKAGISERRIFRTGGDEIVFAAPTGKAVAIIQKIKTRVAEFEHSGMRGSIAGGVGQTTYLADSQMYRDKAAMNIAAAKGEKPSEIPSGVPGAPSVRAPAGPSAVANVSTRDFQAIATRYGNIHPRSVEKFFGALDSARGTVQRGEKATQIKAMRSLLDLVHMDNTFLRRLFRDETGVTLPKTQKDQLRTLLDWAKVGAPLSGINNVKPEKVKGALQEGEKEGPSKTAEPQVAPLVSPMGGGTAEEKAKTARQKGLDAIAKAKAKRAVQKQTPSVYGGMKEIISEGMTVKDWWKRGSEAEALKSFGEDVLRRSVQQAYDAGEPIPTNILTKYGPSLSTQAQEQARKQEGKPAPRVTKSPQPAEARKRQAAEARELIKKRREAGPMAATPSRWNIAGTSVAATQETEKVLFAWDEAGHYLALNPAGQRVLSKLYAHKAPQGIRGLTFTRNQAISYSSRAFSMAKKESDPTARENLRALGTALAEASESREEFAAGLPVVAEHERTHVAQLALQRFFGKGLDAREIEKLPHYIKVAKGLWLKGYRVTDPQVFAMEAAAHIWGGQSDELRITDKEAIDFLQGYFDLIAKTYKADALKRFTHQNAQYRRFRDDLIERFTSEAASAGTGQQQIPRRSQPADTGRPGSRAAGGISGRARDIRAPIAAATGTGGAERPGERIGGISEGRQGGVDQRTRQEAARGEALAEIATLPEDLRTILSSIARSFLDEGREDFDALIGEFEDLLGDEFDDVSDFLPDIIESQALEAARAKETPPQTPSEILDLAEEFATAFATSRSFTTIVQARQWAGRILGIDIKPGSPETKMVDEAIEQGIVRTAREIVSGYTSENQAYNRLVHLYQNQQPNLSSKTSTSVLNQAYSTPIPIAFIASRLAGITPDSTVYEPTAGNGALLIEAKPAHTFANELDPARVENLKETLPGALITNSDATKIKGPPAVDVVIANPPFGAVKQGTGAEMRSKTWQIGPDLAHSYYTIEVDHAVAWKALESMKDDGNAVLILGGIKSDAPKERADGYSGKQKRLFYYTLYNAYNVVDHFTVSGDLYQKQGAGWPIDVIVIQGRGESKRALPAVNVPRIYRAFEELEGVLNEPYRTERGVVSGKLRSPEVSQPGERRDIDIGSGGVGTGTEGVRPGSVLPPTVRTSATLAGTGTGPGERSGGSIPATGVSGTGRPGTAELEGSGRGADIPESDLSGSSGLTRDTREAPQEPSGGERQGTIVTEKGGPRRVGEYRGGEAGGIGGVEPTAQVAYKPASNHKPIGTLVPINLVTTTQDALQRLLDTAGDVDRYVARMLQYDPESPEFKKAFSAEQIDAVALALKNIEGGSGFIIGDQCVAAGTRIYDPISKTHTPIEVLTERGKPITVLALTPNGLRPASASAPFQKGVADLYKVVLDDGRNITVTKQHRFLTHSGWMSLGDGVCVGTLLASVEIVQSERRADDHYALQGNDPSYWDRPEDCLDRYFECSDPDDEQSLEAQDSGLAPFPLQVGVHGRSHDCSRGGGRVLLQAHNHQRPYADLPSKNNSSPAGILDLSSISNQNVASDQRLLGQTHQNSPQFAESIASPLQLSASVLLHQRDRRAFFSSSGNHHTEWQRIQSIEFVRHDEFFDMWVPGYENYTAEGMIHHNTGLGKGRTVAAVMRYAIIKGRIPIFVTEKANLYKDIYRDLVAIGMDDINPLMTNAGEPIAVAFDPDTDLPTVTLKSGSASKHSASLNRFIQQGDIGDHNMIFTTYSQMQTVKAQPTTRQNFISHFADGGIVIFDESHNAGGAEKEERGKKVVPEDRAKFARRIAGLAHGVVYSSATYAKRPSVMDLYFTTNMSLAVGGDIKRLAPAITKGGVPMQQVVASMLTADGQYLRRERSFDGVNYDTRFAPVDRASAESVSSVMRAIVAFEPYRLNAVDNLKDEVAAHAGSVGVDSSTGATGVHSTNFTSIMHNLVNQMLLSLKMDAAADEAIQALKRGEKPVITLANTMGSFIEQYAEANDLKPGDAVGLNFGNLLKRYLERTRTVMIGKPYDKNRISHYLTDEEIGPQGLELYKQINELIDAGDWSKMPSSPIDYIKDKLAKAGYTVGEITGRRHILDYSSGTPRYMLRPQKEISTGGRNKTISAFNGGRLDALIINQAGSTGLSLHAGEDFKDQRRRFMIIAQAEGNIDTHMQLMGRIHRTGQVITPNYVQLVADIPAEKRPAAVLAKKMASLNANTTGARGGALTSKEVVDFMNDYGDEIAASMMEDDPEMFIHLGKPLKSAEGTHGYVRANAIRKVTGRIPLLPIKEQESFYDQLEGEYKDLITRLEAMGENALEAKTLELDAKSIKKINVFEAQGTAAFGGQRSVFAEGADAETMDVKRLGKPMTSAQVLDTLRAHFGDEIVGQATLKIIQAAGVEETTKRLTDIRDRTVAYMSETVDLIEDTDKREAQRVRLNDVFKRLKGVLHLAFVGATVRILSPQGFFYGIVTKVEQKGNPKNPMALGSWRVTMAVADGMRQITVPVSKIISASAGPQTMGDIESRAGGSVVLDRMDTVEHQENMPVLDYFDHAQTESREKRIIITGNLLAGFSRFVQGQLINFRSHEGNIRQGILMPRSFNIATAMEDEPVSFTTSKQILSFLDRVNGLILSGDAVMRITKIGDNFNFTVPSSKSVGGKYFLNENILDAAGGNEFAKAGQTMRMPLPRAIAQRVIDAILAEGTVLHTNSHKEEARSITGRAPLPRPGGAPGADAPIAGALPRRGGSQGGSGLADWFRRRRNPITGQIPRIQWGAFGDAGASFAQAWDKFKNLAVRNLSHLERVSPSAHAFALRAGGSRGQATILLSIAVNKIEKALEDSGITWPMVRAALVESRLRGIRERYQMFSLMAFDATDDEIVDALDNGMMNILQNIQGRSVLSDTLAQQAAAMVLLKDFDGLRNFLGATFETAADHVGRVDMGPDPNAFEKLIAIPAFKEGVRLFKELIEQPIAESHAINEGVFSDALGPLNTYYPLIAVKEDGGILHKLFGATKFPFRKPKNIANYFATGLATHGYSLEMEDFADRLRTAIRTNNKAALLSEMDSGGLIKVLGRNERAPGTGGTYEMEFRGETVPAHLVDTGSDLLIIRDGKSIRVPGARALIPIWLHKEIRPILEKERLEPGMGDGIVNKIIWASLIGPLDLTWHSFNLIGTLIANTPFVNSSLLGMTIGNLPFSKIFTSIIGNLPFSKIFTSIIEIARTNPNTEESIKDLIEMANIGLIPPRYGSVASAWRRGGRKYAERTGNKTSFFGGPLLYGPMGLDIRARLVLYRAAKLMNPGATPAQLFKFVSKLGVYNRELESGIERFWKGTRLAPFATAGTSMLRNGLDAWTGVGPTPFTGGAGGNVGGGFRGPGAGGRRAKKSAYWIAQMLSGGAAGLIALWALTHKAYRKKWPWEEEGSRLLDMKLLPADRMSKLGIMLYGPDPTKDAFVSFAFFSPLVSRGSRALGISGAFGAKQLGGTPGQQFEYARKDVYNSFLHPFTSGPLVRGPFILATGDEPTISSLRDITGKSGLQFYPATIKAAPGLPALGRQAEEAVLNINPFAKTIAGSFGIGEKGEQMERQKQSRWLRMITDVVAPRLIGSAVDTVAAKQRMAKELKASTPKEGLGKAEALPDDIRMELHKHEIIPSTQPHKEGESAADYERRTKAGNEEVSSRIRELVKSDEFKNSNEARKKESLKEVINRSRHDSSTAPKGESNDETSLRIRVKSEQDRLLLSLESQSLSDSQKKTARVLIDLSFRRYQLSAEERKMEAGERKERSQIKMQMLDEDSRTDTFKSYLERAVERAQRKPAA